MQAKFGGNPTRRWKGDESEASRQTASDCVRW
jgi:hypothetical protein